ncbi:hypothetical protein MBANPS3_007548, partial [Mucor bainieri]
STLLSIVALTVSVVSAETAYFSFNTQEYGAPPFVFRLDDDAKIAEVRRMLDGDESSEVSIYGLIRGEDAPYNHWYRYYLDPRSIGFIPGRDTKNCDDKVQYINNNVPRCDLRPQGCFFCAASFTLVSEVRSFS